MAEPQIVKKPTSPQNTQIPTSGETDSWPSKVTPTDLRLLTPAAILSLQRTIGNQAVQRLLQKSKNAPVQITQSIDTKKIMRKATVKYEKEKHNKVIEIRGQSEVTKDKKSLYVGNKLTTSKPSIDNVEAQKAACDKAAEELHKSFVEENGTLVARVSCDIGKERSTLVALVMLITKEGFPAEKALAMVIGAPDSDIKPELTGFNYLEPWLEAMGYKEVSKRRSKKYSNK